MDFSLLRMPFLASFPLWASYPSISRFYIASFLQGPSWCYLQEVSKQLITLCLGRADRWVRTEKQPIGKKKAVKGTFGEGFWEGASQNHTERSQGVWACILHWSGSLPLGYTIYFLITPPPCSPPCCGPWGCPLPQACQLLQAGRRWEKEEKEATISIPLASCLFSWLVTSFSV